MKKQYNENLAVSAVDPIQQILATIKTLETQVGQLQKSNGTAQANDKEKAWLGNADATDPIIQARMKQTMSGNNTIKLPVQEDAELTRWLKIAGLK